MKKFLSVLLACISCVAILFTVACGNTNPPATPDGYTTVDTYNEKSTEQIYTDIMAYVEENNSNFTTSVDYDIDTVIEMMGTKIPVQIYLDEIISISGDSYYNKATMTSVCEDFPGIIPDMWAEVWHVNDVAYINNPKNLGAQKVKVNITWDNLCTRLGIDNDKVFNPVHDFSDVSFENVKFYVDKNVEDSKDVDPYFELQIKGDKAEEFSQDRADQMAGTINDAKVTVSTINYKFYLTENGGLDYIGINYTMNITGKVQGVDVKYDYDFDGEMKFSNVGSTVVGAPSDASSYVDGYLQ